MTNENTKECRRLMNSVLEQFPVFRNDYIVYPEILMDSASTGSCFVYLPGYNYRIPAEKGYRVPPKSLILGKPVVHLFLMSGICPHGITGPEDMGRTWSVKLDVTAKVRRYRHKSFENESLFHRYMYGRSVEDTVRQLKEVFAEMPPSLKEKFDAAGGKNVLP